MRTVKYKVLPAVNPFNAPVPHTVGTLLDLLLAIRYLMPCDIVLPLPVLNEVLGRGLQENGMSGGCQWRPFQLEREEYDELVLELLTLPNYNFVLDDSLNHCLIYAQWWAAVTANYTYDQQLGQCVKKGR